jgi:hypothetical protein
MKSARLRARFGTAVRADREGAASFHLYATATTRFARACCS